MNIVPICPQHAVTHPGMACKIGYRNPFQPQGPGCQQMKSAVPGKIIDPGGGFEEDDGRACRRRRLARNFFCDLRNFEIIEPADQSALDALFVEF